MRDKFVIAIGAAAVLWGGGCVDRTAQSQAERTKALLSDPSVPVTLTLAREETLTETMEVTGEITTTQDSSIGAKSGGRIVAVFVREGDSVSAGQVIAQQDSSVPMAQVRQAQAQVSAAQSALSQALSNAKVGPQRSAAAVATAEAQLRSAKAQLAKARAGARQEEVAQGRAQVAAAKSNMETAKKELDRAKELLDQGAISRQRYEQAENAYSSALSNYESALENLRMLQNWTRPEDLIAAEEAVRQAEEGLRNAKAQKSLDVLLTQQVDAARANLNSARAQLDIANQALADTQIRSPYAGKILGKPVQPGAYLNPGMEVARVIGSGGVYFEGEVPDTLVSRINPGDPVEITLEAAPGRKLSGSVMNVSPSSTEVARTFKVRIGISGSLQEIRPGMFARGVIVLRRIPGAILVPQRAVVEEGGEKYVFTVQDGKAKRNKVTTGLSKNGQVQVLGLPAGIEVVTDGAEELTEGREVKVEKGTPETDGNRADARGPNEPMDSRGA